MERVERNLAALKASSLTFASIYTIMSERFGKEVFARCPAKGVTETVTYAELYGMTERITDAIMARFGKGDGIIGIYMENSVAWVACFWAILRAGRIPLLLNLRQEKSVTEQILAQTKPLLVFSAEPVFPGCATPEEFLTADAPAAEPDWADRILLITSGTTGRPKIICHSGSSICSQVELTSDIIRENSAVLHDRKANIRILAFLPFYHVFGLVSTMMWFSFFGCTLVFLPDYSPKAIQHICRTEGVTHFFSIPLVWDRLAAKVLQQAAEEGKEKQLNRLLAFSNSLQSVFPHLGPWLVRKVLFRTLRERLLGTELTFLIAGGGFLSGRTLEVMNGLGYSLHLGYGLTECGIVSVNLAKRAGKRTVPSCGRIFSNILYRVSPEGELQIGKKNCYTARLEDGVYKENDSDYYGTNDLVTVDGDGQLFIRGRLDDLIVTEGGENLSPEAIETKLDTAGFETTTVVYAALNGKKQLVLVISDKEKSALERARSLEKLFASVERLPLSERPGTVVLLLDAVPRTMKDVNRRALAAGLEDGTLHGIPCTSPTRQEMQQYGKKEYAEILVTVRDCFARAAGKPVEEVNDTTDFLSLGGDSLGYVELLGDISEKTHTEIRLDGKVLLTPMAFADYIIAEREK